MLSRGVEASKSVGSLVRSHSARERSLCPDSVSPMIPLGEDLTIQTASSSINGTLEQAIERFKLREICEGFPVHRDASEWSKFRALFAKEDAYVFTTWSGGVPVDKFVEVSKAGFRAGVRIMHRASGFSVDVSDTHPHRALGKLKATITQRFRMPGAAGGECEVDVEAQCRLCFFLQKDGDAWAIRYFKGIYEKDKAIPVDPRYVPTFDDARLAAMPEGYRFLAYAQSQTNPVLMDLPQLRGEAVEQFYRTFASWLQGNDVAAELGV